MKNMTEQQLEQQIFEMWDAISHIPANDPDKYFAEQEARKVERELRERFETQTKQLK